MTAQAGDVNMYDCWLGYRPTGAETGAECPDVLTRAAVSGASPLLRTALAELLRGLSGLTGGTPAVVSAESGQPHVLIAAPGSAAGRGARASMARPADGAGEVILITAQERPRRRIVLTGSTEAACLHAVFAFLRHVQAGQAVGELHVADGTASRLRMVSHWDNLDGTVERGYAGASIFFAGGQLTPDLTRIRDYARLLASVGVNAVCVNNVNVTPEAARLLTAAHLPRLAALAGVFREYGIRLFLSVSFDSPIVISGLRGADPLDPLVGDWWRRCTAGVYEWIPDFGGFVVKADSESRPGPSVYGRSQAEGANVIAAALRPFGGVVIWRAFVYNCQQDWRDRGTDRARACYDTFMPLDGAFDENVIVQTKIGPMDFQVREPPSPLLSALRGTSQAAEVQITQEYTGQQNDLCFLLPQWHEIMSAAAGLAGVTGVANVGDDPSWTGHVLAQANLYAFGRMAWDPGIEPRTVAAEWVTQTFGRSEPVAATVTRMLLDSWRTYESYTAPLGVGWMVTPGTHYGPSVDGYEYSRWGTYHFADREGIGVDRTVKTGSGFTAQYEPGLAQLYEDLASCPDELLLFFHHVPYRHRLKSGKTVIQHIYDSHFDGAEQAQQLLDSWLALAEHLDPVRFRQVRGRLELQLANAQDWRDVVNSYFFRKSGIPDERGRMIF